MAVCAYRKIFCWISRQPLDFEKRSLIPENVNNIIYIQYVIHHEEALSGDGMSLALLKDRRSDLAFNLSTKEQGHGTREK